MKLIKSMMFCFIGGGVTAVIGQGFLTLYGALLGPGLITIALSLISLGVLGAILTIAGIFPKLEKAAGFGAGLSFGGFCAAVAGTYAATMAQTNSAGKALKAALMLVLLVIGTGIALAFIVGLISFLAKGGAA
jgi:hypothetical protein